MFKLVPDKVSEIIQSDNFDILRSAALNRDVETMKYLIDVMLDKVDDMVCSSAYFRIFHSAAFSKNIANLEYVISLAPEKRSEMVCVNNFQVFRNVAGDGNISMLKYLIKLAPEKVEQMLAAESFEAIINAAKGRCFEILNFLLDLEPIYVNQRMTDECFKEILAAVQMRNQSRFPRLVSGIELTYKTKIESFETLIIECINLEYFAIAQTILLKSNISVEENSDLFLLLMVEVSKKAAHYPREAAIFWALSMRRNYFDKKSIWQCLINPIFKDAPELFFETFIVCVANF